MSQGPPTRRDQDSEVVATIDRDDENVLVIADLSTDESWISMRASEAPVLVAWR